ncbi:hypothetical protein [Streptomyces sp. AC555_RSS877]|uniref:TRADD-N-associated membrane domain-containing protein n=1 Tax=Streptomyces sp. AC555_RSS877 TaxID=2823688 RepID=UPI001C263D7D|nr:hypothetical protein [Streptomyces sp. AC555_RSS877]
MSVGAGLFTLFVGSALYSLAYPPDKGSGSGAAGFVVYVVTLLTGLAPWFYPEDGGAPAAESRQRVREAERDFEEALRAAQVPVDVADESRQRVREAERDFEMALRAAQALADAEDAEEADARPAVREPVGGSRDSRSVGLALPELWAVTHSRLDHYRETALRQARRSFRNAQVAMVLGFVLLVGFVAVAVYAKTTAAAAVAGGLGAVSAALAGYVSQTFVRSQEASASHLRAYFDQPLEFARFLAAERIVMDGGLSQEQRAEVLSALVQAMVSGPSLPGGPGQQPGPG